jgi:hypothetical protein
MISVWCSLRPSLAALIASDTDDTSARKKKGEDALATGGSLAAPSFPFFVFPFLPASNENPQRMTGAASELCDEKFTQSSAACMLFFLQ